MSRVLLLLLLLLRTTCCIYIYTHTHNTLLLLRREAIREHKRARTTEHRVVQLCVCMGVFECACVCVRACVGLDIREHGVKTGPISHEIGLATHARTPRHPAHPRPRAHTHTRTRTPHALAPPHRTRGGRPLLLLLLLLRIISRSGHKLPCRATLPWSSTPFTAESFFSRPRPAPL